MVNKIFTRFHLMRNISLKDMQKKADNEHGLCCYMGEKIDTDFLYATIDFDETGEVIIFIGKIRSLCPEGYKVYPTEIIDRIPIRCEGHQEIRGNTTINHKKIIREIK